ncbi:MAG TPA: hypothetical protein VFF70_11900, partial [Anaerolineae bacterium]|nr:hypothetical protein [Anaerolineae bacterium]
MKKTDKPKKTVALSKTTAKPKSRSARKPTRAVKHAVHTVGQRTKATMDLRVLELQASADRASQALEFAAAIDQYTQALDLLRGAG